MISGEFPGKRFHYEGGVYWMGEVFMPGTVDLELRVLKFVMRGRGVQQYLT